MRKLQADFIFPISSPAIKGGILITEDDGKIIEVIDPLIIQYSLNDIEKHNGILCPGFINAHCHLELSHLRGVITEKKGMANFISELLQNRFKTEDDELQQSFIDAEKEMLQNGIVAVGDISNFASTIAIKQKGKLFYHTFVEVLAPDPSIAKLTFTNGKKIAEQFKDLPNGNASVVPHAPYTVSNELLDLINNDESDLPVSIHLHESEAEIEFCKNHTGPFAELFTRLNFNFKHTYPSGFRPIHQVMNHLTGKKNLALVHNTYTTREEIKWANDLHKNLYWCLCPIANLFIENRLPDIKSFIEEGSKIIMGTDSLASNHELSVLEELKTIAQYFREIKLEKILEWATINGAKFLHIENKFGSFEKNKHPGIVLLKNIDSGNLTLTAGSSVVRLL